MEFVIGLEEINHGVGVQARVTLCVYHEIDMVQCCNRGVIKKVRRLESKMPNPFTKRCRRGSPSKLYLHLHLSDGQCTILHSSLVYASDPQKIIQDYVLYSNAGY